MKIFKKVIKKVPLPLMFVTFVLAVLMLAAGPLSAAPNCDSDGDTFIKDSKYCRNKYEGPYDCDDSTHSDTNDCSGGSGGNTAPDPYNLARASFATRALNSALRCLLFRFMV